MLILNVLTIDCNEVPPSGSISNGEKAGENDFPYIVAIGAHHMIKGGRVSMNHFQMGDLSWSIFTDLINFNH